MCFIEEKIKQISVFSAGKYFCIYSHLYVNMQITPHLHGYIKHQN